MTTWAGWASYFLGGHGVPDTAGNRQFLEDWATHANSPKCRNNPIDLTATNTASANCKAAYPPGRSYQRYTLPTYARTAFYAQLTGGHYQALWAAMQTGKPATVDYWQQVADDIGAWGSNTFADVYLSKTNPAAVADVTAAHAHGGWADLRRTFNHTMPSSLRAQRRSLTAGLRAVHRASKVRL